MWYAKSTGGYAKESDEAKANATEIYNILSGQGWSHNAICACLGNNNHEGQYNPWRWEADNVPTLEQWQEEWKDSTSHGYGMWGFTPSSKYIESTYARNIVGFGPNYSNLAGVPEDGRAQTYFMNSGGSGWITRSRFNNMSFEQYKVSTETLSYLTEVFLYCFENPANPQASYADRYEAAVYWDNYFNGYEPTPDPDPPGPSPDPPPGPVYINDRHRWKFYLLM